MTRTRHPDADTLPVSIERSDAIDAAAGLYMLARDYRRQARQRRYAGAANASHRQHLRDTADVYDAAAARVQSVADNAYAS
jgi:hypothetical protein